MNVVAVAHGAQVKVAALRAAEPDAGNARLGTAIANYIRMLDA